MITTPANRDTATMRTSTNLLGSGQTILALLVVGLLSLGSFSPSMAPVFAAHQRVTLAAPIRPQAALDRFMTAPHVVATWFAPSVRAQVNVTQLEQIRANFIATLGAYRSVKPQVDGSFLLTFQNGTLVSHIALDGQGRITTLFFSAPQLTNNTNVIQSFNQLPGQVSVLITANGTTKTAMNGDQPLAVGSTFKLSILAALQRQIQAGQHSWSQVVTLRPQDKSLPTGTLQTWPAGSHLTVETLASLMISQSDNTAADMLLHLVGRPAIDPLVPQRDRPILSTHALFVLKDPAHADLLTSYLTGDATKRLTVIKQAEGLPLPSPGLFAGAPIVPQVEWFFSTKELCGLMQQVHTLPLMGINPGLANAGNWAHVAFKGGSEPGVISLTTMLTSQSGATYCVSATWNNTTVLDENRFETLYASLLSTLH